MPNQSPRSLTPRSLTGALATIVVFAMSASWAQPPGDGPEVLLQVSWGSGAALLSTRGGDESAPEGPMSFALGPEGEIYVLDQAVRRIVVFGPDRTTIRAIPIPADTIQDIEVLEDGRILALDRLVRSSVTILDPQGRVLGEVSVLGPGVEQGGRITAMIARRDGVWLEVDHARVVRVLDKDLEPGDRAVRLGRFTNDDRVGLGAALDGIGGARLWRMNPLTGVVEKTVDIRFEHRIDRIIWLEVDAHDRVVVMFHLLEWDRGDPARVIFEEVVAVRYTTELTEVDMFRSPYTITEWEQFREFRVLPTGEIIQMAFTDEGVLFLRWK